MGQSDSKQLIVCSFCASEITPPDSTENGKTSSTNNDSRHSTDNDNNNEHKSNGSASSSMNIQLPPNTLICPRCYGYHRKPTSSPSSRRRISSFLGSGDNNNNNSNNNNDLSSPIVSSIKGSNGRLRCRRYIEHLHIAPFQDTLEQIEEKEISERYIVETYLRPYFESEAAKHTQFRAKNRIIIKNVEFKIFGCHPPKGMVSNVWRISLHSLSGCNRKDL